MKIPCLPPILALCLLAASPQAARAEAASSANAEGESNKTTAPTNKPLFPPAAPTNLRVTRLSATQNKIEWDHNGQNVTEYHLYRAKGDEDWDYLWGDTNDATQLKPVVIAAGSKTYLDDHADADFPYRYRVKATSQSDEYSNFSAPSNEVAEYSAKVTLLAGVGRTPLPKDHPQPSGSVSLTNGSGKPTDTLSGPYSTYLPYGPPENNDQASWSGSLKSYRKTGETYTEDVSVQVAGKLIAPDPEHPLYDIGDLFGSVGTGTTSSVLGPPENFYVAPDRSHATVTSHGNLAIFLGKLEPPPATGLAYDSASNPRWLALKGSGSQPVRFTLAPARPDLTKRFTIGGNIQVSPADTTSADQTVTLQSQNDISEQRTLSASVETGEVARLQVDMRQHRTMAVAMMLLTQSYAGRRGVVFDDIPPLHPPAEYSSNWPTAANIQSQLQTFLNSVFEPQMNITVTVTSFTVSKDYDVGVTDGFLDVKNRAETDVIEGIISEHSGFDKYLFFVHEFGQAGKTEKYSAAGISPKIPSNYCFVHDFSFGLDPLQTAAHELGHALGLRHIWDNSKPHRGYAPYERYNTRVMTGGVRGVTRERFSQAEREIVYEALAKQQQTPP